MNKLKLFLYLILILNVELMFAQTIIVTNQSTNEPIENVAIFNKQRNVSTLSDKNGIAKIDNFSESDSIFFQHPSFCFQGIKKTDITKEHYLVELISKNILMNEFVISATKSSESKEHVANMIDVIPQQKIETETGQTSADILMSTGNIYVQKTQGGGGSPVIRGFEANKILLVLDGVRLNNAIYRSGHLQNAITIDNGILERVEIIYGPGSLIYGSDALGGVIHYYTRNPKLSYKNGKMELGVNTFTQYATNNEGKLFHTDINLGYEKAGQLLSFTAKDFGDIKIGNRNTNYPEKFGYTYHYAKRFHHTDSMLNNPDPKVQKNTGYRQYDFLCKLKYNAGSNLTLLANLQYSTSSNIDRYDNLQEYKNDHLKYAEWYYGPQNRLFASLSGEWRKRNQFFDDMNLIIAFQDIQEDRVSRKFGVDDKLYQKENVKVYSLNADFLKLTQFKNHIHYGIEMSFNQLNSLAYYENIEDDSSFPAETRYPGGDNFTQSYALYGSYKWFISNRFVLYSGIRYSYTGLYSTFISSDIFTLPFNEININNGALTGSLNLIHHPNDTWQFNYLISTGYRNPNIDDYGKIRAKDENILIPMDGLKPEYTLNIEYGITKTIGEFLKLQGNGYVSFIRNAIVRTFGTINNMDSIEYDGDLYRVQYNTNAQRAIIQGISIGAYADLKNGIKLNSTFNYLEGKNLTNDEPLGHILPVYGRSSISYSFNKLDFIFFVNYNGKKEIADISPYGEDNEGEGTAEGFPGWYTININSEYRINDHFTVQLAVENILDQYYKTFASAISAPGRNFLLTFRAKI